MPNVLLIEPDPAVREALAMFLDGAGWTVLSAHSARHARHLLRVRDSMPDVILAALGGWRGDGWDLDRFLSRLPDRSTVPVVYYGDRVDLPDAPRSAAGLRTPVDVDVLVQTLTRVIEDQGRGRDRRGARASA